MQNEASDLSIVFLSLTSDHLTHESQIKEHAAEHERISNEVLATQQEIQQQSIVHEQHNLSVNGFIQEQQSLQQVLTET